MEGSPFEQGYDNGLGRVGVGSLRGKSRKTKGGNSIKNKKNFFPEGQLQWKNFEHHAFVLADGNEYW
jgi:hypothetical protein